MYAVYQVVARPHDHQCHRTDSHLGLVKRIHPALSTHSAPTHLYAARYGTDLPLLMVVSMHGAIIARAEDTGTPAAQWAGTLLPHTWLCAAADAKYQPPPSAGPVHMTVDIFGALAFRMAIQQVDLAAHSAW